MDIALVDDRPEDLEKLTVTLKAYSAGSGQHFRLHAFSGGEELLKDFRRHSYAIIFLDVYMHGLSGIGTAERIRAVDGDAFLVFLTISDEHQAEAIHYHVFDYLSKDAGEEAVFRVLDRILGRRTKTGSIRLEFVSGKTRISLDFDDLVYLTADRNYLMIHDRDGKEYRTRMTFSAALSLLESDGRFVQILRGVIVNMDFIRDLTRTTCILDGDIRLPVSMRSRDRVERIWTNYIFAKMRRESAEGDK